MPYLRWLSQLKIGDTVAVYIGSERKADAVVTSAPRTIVTIGKHANRRSFRRSDGMLASKMYRRHLFRIEQP